MPQAGRQTETMGYHDANKKRKYRETGRKTKEALMFGAPRHDVEVLKALQGCFESVTCPSWWSVTNSL